MALGNVEGYFPPPPPPPAAALPPLFGLAEARGPLPSPPPRRAGYARSDTRAHRRPSIQPSIHPFSTLPPSPPCRRRRRRHEPRGEGGREGQGAEAPSRASDAVPSGRSTERYHPQSQRETPTRRRPLPPQPPTPEQRFPVKTDSSPTTPARWSGAGSHRQCIACRARTLRGGEEGGGGGEREREGGGGERRAISSPRRGNFFPILSVSLFIPFSLRRWRKKEGDEKKDSGFWILNLGERDIYIYIYSRRRGYCLVTAVRL